MFQPFPGIEWNDEVKEFVVEINSDFILRLKSLFVPTDTLMIMCRSGDRSAVAVNAFVGAEFVNIYNIIDDMEGDDVNDPGSVYREKLMRNGWKNCGAPWT